jgi:peroxiredoxin
MTARRSGAIAAALLLSVALAAGCSASGSERPASVPPSAAVSAAAAASAAGSAGGIGEADAPAFSGQTITGGTVSSTDLRRTGPVVLIFFSSWCQVCAEAQSGWNDLATEYQGRATVVGVVADEKADELSRYLAAHPVDYPVISDPERKIWRSFAAYEPPMVVLIGASGKLIRGWPGGIDAETVSVELGYAVA